MISRIEARNFRCLRKVDQRLDRFHVLVGPNASGKSTFLDVLEFLSDVSKLGVHDAAYKRSSTFDDLVWRKEPDSQFGIEVEARIPSRFQIGESAGYDTLVFETTVGLLPKSGEISILAERALLKRSGSQSSPPEKPFESSDAKSIWVDHGGSGDLNSQRVRDTGYGLPSALTMLKVLSPAARDDVATPAGAWFASVIDEQVHRVALDNRLLRAPSRPGKGFAYVRDGSNLPWVIDWLLKEHRDVYADWLAHIQTVFPDLVGIRVVERPEDRFRYIQLAYKGGFEAPSWTASEGTLRLMALTLLAYLPERAGIYLIEEPENGIHPLAIEAVVQSLSSVYDGQVLLATHSPIILSVTEPKDVLCFAKDDDGASVITPGDRHPALQNWRGEENLGILYASGVLG